MQRWSRVALVVTALAAGSTGTRDATAQPPSPPSLAERARLRSTARSRGRARVIVGFRTPTAVEREDRLSRAAVRLQRAAIAASRSGLLARLALYRLETTASYDTIPYVAVEVDEEALDALLGMPEVTTVVEDVLARPALVETLAVIGADLAADRGYVGAGRAVAILDTGVEATHSFFGGRVVWEGCFSTTNASFGASTLCPNGQESMTGVLGAASPSTCAGIGGCDHGTHVAGIAAGSGATLAGVARGADVLAFQIFTRFDDAAICGTPPCLLSFLSDQIAALEQVYLRRGAYDIAAANLSLGGGQYFSTCDGSIPAFADIVEQLRSAGIATVISSGNDGFSNATSSPGCVSGAVTVGATTDGDRVASFSNSAPWLDVLAPGVLVRSSVTGNGFGTKSGTSMATPHVTGAFAVLKAANPAATVEEILDALRQHGVDVLDPKSGLTTPRIQVDAAIESGPPRILTAILPEAVAGTPYSASIAFEGGSAPLQVSLEAGLLPVGLQGPDPSSGLIQGTPYEAGVFPLRIRVTDANGLSDERLLNLRVGLRSPTLLAPTGGAVTSDPEVAFQWTAVVGASRYELVVEDASSGGVVVERAGLSGTSRLEVLPHGRFEWRVRAVHGAVESLDSAVRVLDVDVVPPSAVSLEATLPPARVKIEGALASGASGELSTFVRGNAVDGRLDTFWASPLRSSNGEEWIAFDLGEVRSVSRVRIHPRVDTTAAFPRDFEIQLSADGVAYGTVHAEADFVVSGAEWQDFDFPAAPGRYLRLRVTELNRYGPTYFDAQIAEVEIYEAVPPVGAVELRWIAPGDDAETGTAAAYDLRYVEGASIDFDGAIPVPDLPVPLAAGQEQTFVVEGLDPETTYAFAMRVIDDAENLSAVSTPAVHRAPGPPPGAVRDLNVTSIEKTSVTLAWSAPFESGDKGGAAAAYDVRYAPVPITEASFAAAIEATGEPSPGAPGTAESMRVEGLESSTLYYFALRSTDAADNVSFVSNVVAAETADGVAPAPIGDLVAAAESGGTTRVAPLAVTDSSGALADLVGARAVDGDPASFWASPLRSVAQTEFLTVDLGDRTPVARVRLLSRSDTALAFPRDFSVQLSGDGQTFTTLASEEDFVAAPGSWYERDVPVTEGRFLRVLVTESNRYGSSFNVQIAEVEVYRWDPPSDAVRLSWTATGDDGLVGAASLYDVRYSDRPIDAASFAAATPVSGAPLPGEAGTFQSMTVPSLGFERLLHFAVRAIDDEGNVSDVVPGASVVTPGLAPAAPVLSVLGSGLDRVTLGWTATADDGSSGAPATSYDLRVSTTPIASLDDYLAGTPVPLSAPGAPGAAETAEVSGLGPDALHYFALRVLDDVGNASELSNVASGKTADDVPPAPVLDLTAILGEASYQLRPTAGIEASSALAPYEASNASDGVLETYWSSPLARAVGTAQLTLDLGAIRRVGRVRLHPRLDTTAGFPRALEIQVSEDGESYVTAHTASRTAPPAASWLSYELDPTPGRYVRLRVETSPYGIWYVAQIAEIAVDELVPAGVVLRWTAPGDNGENGRASGYDVRYQSSPITSDAEFDAALPVEGAPVPGHAGTEESFVVTEVPGESRLHFAVAALDEAGHRSVGASASVVTPGVPPAAIEDLAASPESSTSVRLSWTAVGDDGPTTGRAASYDVRSSTAPILGDTDFEGASPVVSGVPSPPAEASARESFVVSGLASGVVHYFAVRVADEVGNLSPISNVAASTTADDVPPSPVTSLAARLTPSSLVPVEAAGAAASSALAGLPAGFARDADLSTFWGAALATTVRTEWITVELDAPELVGRVRLHPRVDTTAAFPRDFQIQVSLDGVAYATVHEEADFVASESRFYPFDVAPVLARFVRVLVTETAPFGIWRTVQLAEVEVDSAVPSGVELTWTAPGDDGDVGSVSFYEVRYATTPVATPVTRSDFLSMTLAGIHPATEPAGGEESFAVAGLAPGDYDFVVRAVDDSGNESFSLGAASVSVP